MRIKFEIQIISPTGSIEIIKYKTLREICSSHDVEYHHIKTRFKKEIFTFLFKGNI